jgi:hypothetical protein
MSQLTLTNEIINRFCPNCKRGLAESDVYAKDFTLNNMPVEIHSFYCSNCKEGFTYIKCIKCGEEFSEDTPKNMLDIVYAYYCPKCRGKK